MEDKEEKLANVTFSFYPTDHGHYHDTYLSFSVHDDMDLFELHSLCKRFAAILGFCEGAIEEVFGEDYH